MVRDQTAAISVPHSGVVALSTASTEADKRARGKREHQEGQGGVEQAEDEVVFPVLLPQQRLFQEHANHGEEEGGKQHAVFNQHRRA